jgi:hypothetical protein
MSSHTHTIAHNASKTGATVLPDSIPGPTGPQGPKGATGPAGPQGPTGPVDAAVGTRVTTLEGQMANVILRVAALEAKFTPPAPSGVVATLGPSTTSAQLLAKMADMTIDAIELTAGTFTLGSCTHVNIDRTARPLTVRPAAGASVVLEGGLYASQRGAFQFGDGGGSAKYITMQDLILDGYTLDSTGIFWLGNADHITLPRMTVRNSTGIAGQSWALYVSYDGSVSASNVVANGWIVDGGARTIGGAGLGHDSSPEPVANVQLHDWDIANAAYSVYSSHPCTGVDIDGWTIAHTGLTTYAYISTLLANGCGGTIKNCHATDSGELILEAPMVDGGGNSWA